MSAQCSGVGGEGGRGWVPETAVAYNGYRNECKLSEQSLEKPSAYTHPEEGHVRTRIAPYPHARRPPKDWYLASHPPTELEHLTFGTLYYPLAWRPERCLAEHPQGGIANPVSQDGMATGGSERRGESKVVGDAVSRSGGNANATVGATTIEENGEVDGSHQTSQKRCAMACAR